MSKSVRRESQPGQPDTNADREKNRHVCVSSAHGTIDSQALRGLELASAPLTVQETALAEVVRSDPDLITLLRAARDAELPDCWLTAGAVYQTVWNALTGQPRRHGIKDYDVCYCDTTDLSSESQSGAAKRIRDLVGADGDPDLNLEVVNQARVHLWFEKRFGFPVSPLDSTAGSLLRYACTHHAVAVQLTPDGKLRSMHPFGLDDVFGMRVRPNRALPNRETHRTKAARAQAAWPEVVVEEW